MTPYVTEYTTAAFVADVMEADVKKTPRLIYIDIEHHSVSFLPGKDFSYHLQFYTPPPQR